MDVTFFVKKILFMEIDIKSFCLSKKRYSNKLTYHPT